MVHYSIDGIGLDLTFSSKQIVIVARFGFSYQGYGSKAKGVFKINPVDDSITSWKIFDAKGHVLLSYGSFSDPKLVADVKADLMDTVNTSAPGDFAVNFYPVWNHLFDGDFKVATKGKGMSIDVGTGGLATIVGSKGSDTVHVIRTKDINFDGKGGSDTLSFQPQNGDEPVSGGAVVDLTSVTSANPFGGTLTLKSVENLAGTIYDDDFTGNDANNILDGGWDGIDSLRGGGGNDTLIVLPSQHFALADGGAGKDTLWIDASLSPATSHLLDLNTPANNTGVFQGATVTDIENFRLDAFVGNVTFEFRGTDAAETVHGGLGGDTLIGNGGNDVLIGGRNILNSPAGRDTLTGGLGADRFVFENRLDSSSGGSFDLVTDFSHAEHDKIDLRGVDANTLAKGNQAFKFIGEQAFHHKAGELKIDLAASPGDSFVLGDVNGDGIFDFIIRVDGVTNLVKGDFLL